MSDEVTRSVVEEGQLPEVPTANVYPQVVMHIQPQQIFRPERIIWSPPTDGTPNPMVTFDDVNWRIVGRARGRRRR